MSAYVMVQLSCDDPSVCGESLDDATSETATEARRAAKREGWVRVRSKNPADPPGHMLDLCAKHAKSQG